jgi:S-(hydroxymethyl)glutathione dehydrogenase/alcohol dehydrogenase
MKAAVLFKPNEPLQVRRVRARSAQGQRGARQDEGLGVCQSDWHIMNGDWPSPMPIVPGHEAAGEIAECGPGVTTVKPGDHVIFSFRPHCGRCKYCTMGRTVLCIGRAAVPPGSLYDGTLRIKHKGQGINQMARIGTFAEEVVVPEEMVVPIRKDMPWPQAALVGCCVATGVGAVTPPRQDRGRLDRAGDRLRRRRPERHPGRDAVGRADDHRRRHPRQQARDGEDLRRHAHRSTRRPATSRPREVKEITGGLGVDYSFDAVSVEGTQALAFDALAPGGHAVAVGISATSVKGPVLAVQ